MNEVGFAFLLTLLAGLATGVGGLVVMFSKLENKRILSICLSFAAGVMLYISFVEILFKGLEVLEEEFVPGAGYAIGTVAFFAGITVIALIDRLMPHNRPAEDKSASSEKKELKRTGIMSAAAIAIHNFPEGFLTFMAAMYDPALGVAVAIAIALHNIPEGLAMAQPIYYATGSKKKALAVATSSGLTEPLGGLFAWFLLSRLFDDIGIIFGISFAFAGGIMVFVALHQLLPAAKKYGSHNMVMRWLFIGMAFIAVSLIALEMVL